ncbi:MAG: HlyD family efflux transporter periplasmic adaptor subunit, partial [Alphaproteobacteria bacterium]|nr:HlyD family efflux transporter periplasmic adaptor subunit [Alphaproteobacteria bacterium]
MTAMSPVFRRIAFWAVPIGLLAVGLGFALRPQSVAVDIATVAQGPLIVTVEEQGETRIRDVFTVSAPVRGRALRIDIEEGDAVIGGETVVAEIEPIEPEFLDARTAAEARMAVVTAEAGVGLAEASLEQARAELDYASAHVERMRKLSQTNTVSASVLDDAERAFRSRQAAVATAQAAVRMRQSELAAARVRLQNPGEPLPDGDGCPCIPIRSPVSGEVLRVLHESEGVVAAGERLLEVGNPRDLEIVADFPSADAVRIEPGQRVIVDQWGGDRPLNGKVRTVEPYGYTKVSALGIEEQRVNVIVDLTDPPEVWRRLGHGFEVEVRVVLSESENATTVPLTALFREGEAWAVFAVQEDRAVLRTVRLG